MKETMLQGNQIEIKKVSSKKDMDAFIGFYCDLYKDNKYAVPFIRFDEENTLSKERNSSFEFCEAEYYLALRGGKVVGRVAAIIVPTRSGRRSRFASDGSTSLTTLMCRVLCWRRWSSMAVNME